VQRLEALILTHPDADHIGGAAAVLESFDVDAVIDPGLPAGKDMYIDLLAAARSDRMRWIAGRAGIRFELDGVAFEFLYPERELDALRDANDNSVVFRLVFGSFTALFLGDAPSSVEEELVARHGTRMRTTVLKVGHHGSATSTSDALLAAARPTLALISVGERNRYGHPAPTVMRRLVLHEVRVLRTDELGHVIVRAQRDGSIDAHARR
jgi:competence protein ComEC